MIHPQAQRHMVRGSVEGRAPGDVSALPKWFPKQLTDEGRARLSRLIPDAKPGGPPQDR